MHMSGRHLSSPSLNRAHAIGRASLLRPQIAQRSVQNNQAYKTEKKNGLGRAPLLAALDLGTNNCRLLIAEPMPPDSFRIVDSFSRIVRLGEGLSETGRLSDAAIERTIAALKICAERIERHHVRHVRAIATQAARQASNTDRLVDRALKEAGIALEVITSEMEADFAALGCAPLIGQRYRGAMIFDIGGGSTELVWQRRQGDRLEKIFATSLPVGVVNVAEHHGEGAQGRNGFETMRDEMVKLFRPLTKKTEGFDPDVEHLLGTSGTVTTLAALALKLPRYVRAKVDGSWHPTKKLMNVVERVSRLDVEALAGLGAVGPERADLMLAGSAIFAAICTLWPSPMLRVADRGLREGMLRQMRDEILKASV
jgi:exopolyphosphatase / guanosine-5'-triphosphate,3'-diphosphate pyrophosphatase